jgi:hypothetical protein
MTIARLHCWKNTHNWAVAVRIGLIPHVDSWKGAISQQQQQPNQKQQQQYGRQRNQRRKPLRLMTMEELQHHHRNRMKWTEFELTKSGG